MADLIRSAKSGSDWTTGDLDAYNVVLNRQDAATFFGVQQLPLPQIDAEIMNMQNASDMMAASNKELMTLLDFAMMPNTGSPEESAVDDFAVCLLRTLHYIEGERVARTRKDIPLFICGEWRHAKTDVCLIDSVRNNMMLLVQENKRFGEGEQIRQDAQAQLVAEAVAAFCWNNTQRWEAGLAELQSQIIPGIVMTGTTPTFYKIPVTIQLVNAVPRMNRRWSEGMKPLDNRQHILKCYEAFKAIIGI